MPTKKCYLNDRADKADNVGDTIQSKLFIIHSNLHFSSSLRFERYLCK